nr:hypothetical protein [Sorangium cellulosum]
MSQGSLPSAAHFLGATAMVPLIIPHAALESELSCLQLGEVDGHRLSGRQLLADTEAREDDLLGAVTAVVADEPEL